MNYCTVRRRGKLGNLIHRPQVRQVFKILLTFLLIISWTLTGWPQIWNFPPKIQEASAVYVGTGGDGSVTISTSQNINTAVLGSLRSINADGIVTTVSSFGSASGGTTLTVASATGFAAEDEIMVINLRGDATNNGNVGNYEFLRILSIATNTFTFETTIKNLYGATTSNLILTGQSVVAQRVPQWTSVTINSGGTLTANTWSGTSGGTIVFRATDTVTVNTGGTISANAIGYAGGGSSTTGGGLNGESYDGVGSAGVSAGGDDTISGSGGGNIGTRGGGGSSNSGISACGNTAGTRGGGGGGGNADANITTDGAGGGAGGGYGFGGAGGAGGGDSTAGGVGGTAGSTSVNGGGGGGGGDGPNLGGAGGNAGSAGGSGNITGSGGGEGGAVGSGTSTGKGGCGGTTTFSGIGGAGGGGGGSYGDAALSDIFLGSGGGGGGGHDATTATAGATGGAGGGIIHISAGTISLPGTGTITANAANGAVGSIVRVGSSGGGAGGSIYLSAVTTTLGTNLVTATGGSGAAAQTAGGGGGAGGHGRIRVEATTITGTTNPTLSSSPIPLFTQSAYRFFNNADSTDVGTALAAQDTAATLGSAGAAFRLRLLLHINTLTATARRVNPERFKLQFAAQSGTCDTGFVGETYADVTAATVIAFNNNAPADNAALTVNVNDPTHSTDTIVPQTYEEANMFSNTEADIATVQDGKWDFSLKDNGATAGTAYCFRAVRSDATVLNTYTVIPQITTAPPAVLTQNDFEFWVDNDLLTPVAIWGNPDIAENTALNALPPSNDPIDPADEIRIRMNISVTVATLAVSTEDFILQYKEAQDCTDAAAWTDVDAAAGAGTWRFAASTVADNTTLTTLLVATSDVAGRYNKSDPTTTNPNAVTAGQEFEWDWHVEYNGPAAARTYCFRMVKSPVAALDAYNADSYPRIDTRPGNADLMGHGNFFTTGVERGFFWAD